MKFLQFDFVRMKKETEKEAHSFYRRLKLAFHTMKTKKQSIVVCTNNSSSDVVEPKTKNKNDSHKDSTDDESNPDELKKNDEIEGPSSFKQKSRESFQELRNSKPNKVTETPEKDDFFPEIHEIAKEEKVNKRRSRRLQKKDPQSSTPPPASSPPPRSELEVIPPAHSPTPNTTSAEPANSKQVNIKRPTKRKLDIEEETETSDVEADPASDVSAGGSSNETDEDNSGQKTLAYYDNLVRRMYKNFEKDL